ncbi:MAG: DUF456 domain-containing protein [Bacteroidetes bacterium]|nr:MAG: DUF456 domain-containing protein [Bacteroidota bacterium]RLD94769.1 MAG: DUF456 domain-containing protein [Bacteroidota bacterium]
MDITLAVLGAALVLVGFIGSILPIIPGPPISWAGLLLLKWTDFVDDHGAAYENALWILLFFVILVTILDYVVPIMGTKKYGGSKRGVWGATIGVVVGLFFGPLGIIIGPFLGAYIGEISTGKKDKDALRAAWGSFMGFLLGVGLKLMVCGTILFFFIRYLFF